MSEGKTCAAFAPGTISGLIDGALTPYAAWRVRRHVQSCDFCAAELAAERRLQSAARALHADAVPAKALREKAFAALPVATSGAGRVSALTAAFAVACVTLLGGASAFLTFLARPLPAFAQVERAMDDIAAIRFTVKNSVYDVKTQKAIYYGGEDAARTEPPALRNDYGPDDFRVETGQGVLRVRKAGRPLRVIYEIMSPHSKWYAGTEHDQPARLRRIMREELLTPQLPPEGAKKGPVHWVDNEELVEGQNLLRFQIGMGAGRTERGERLTRPGYRQIVWADPETHRLVRAFREYYDGKSHSTMDWTNFRYNESLPDSLFSLTPPKNAQLLK